MTTMTPAQPSPRGESGRSGTFTAPASKPWERRLTRLIVVCILILVGVFFWVSVGKPTLGPLTMRATLATLPLFALLCIGWVPVVWAALRWMVRDTLRRFLLPIRGRHARAPHPGVATVAFVLSASAFAFAYTEFGAGYLPALLDWWEGPAHYEGLTCQNLQETKGNRRHAARTMFDLVDAEGHIQHIELNREDFKTQQKRSATYATVAAACQSPDTRISISIYERTSIIADASVDQ